MTATDDAATRVLLAILNGAGSRTEIAAATSLKLAVIHTRCHQLRDAGLINWQDGCAGTMRALVQPVTPPRPPEGRAA